MKRPAFQFYPADWRNDAALRLCSLAARGLWWEMICLMHMAEPYGHLVAAGRSIDATELARVVGESKNHVQRWLDELKARQVFSVTDDGAIYSRRMVRDEAERQEWAKRQRKHRDNPRDTTDPVTPIVTPESRLSSSSSSSSIQKGAVAPLSGSPPDEAPKNGHDPKSEKRGQLQRDAREILTFLNAKAGRNFPPSDSNVGIVVARIKEGFTVEQVRQVIANRVRKWKGDEKMAEFLRPATLFGRANFSNYVGELVDAPGGEE